MKKRKKNMQAEINIFFWTECFYFFFSQKFALCGQMINGTAKFYKKVSIFSCFLIRGSHLFQRLSPKKQKEF